MAVVLNAASSPSSEGRRLPDGALLVAGLAAGLAAGTKLNYLLPAFVLVAGIALAAPNGARLRSLGLGGLAALAGGGYWYLRNLAHTGNPLPWFTDLGPISLPGPDQTLGGREGHSVLGYLTDGSVWSEWFLPGLHHGLTFLWPLLGAVALAGLLLALGPRSNPYLRVAGAVGLAAALAWLIAPTSASGPDGMPRGFESGLRYLAPALILGMALLPIAVQRLASRRGRRSSPERADTQSADLIRSALVRTGDDRAPFWRSSSLQSPSDTRSNATTWRTGTRTRHSPPPASTPSSPPRGPISGERIATTSTRQYPLFGTDLSNRVEFVGRHEPHGGFVAPTSCAEWRRLINEGEYEYVVASRDRIEPGRPPYPASARWTEGPTARLILAVPPTKVFRLSGPLDPSTC